jgi:hypothetical protein
VAVAQSVEFACGLKATELVCCESPISLLLVNKNDPDDLNFGASSVAVRIRAADTNIMDHLFTHRN